VKWCSVGRDTGWLVALMRTLAAMLENLPMVVHQTAQSCIM
jgi:hypothetical protein